MENISDLINNSTQFLRRLRSHEKSDSNIRSSQNSALAGEKRRLDMKHQACDIYN